MEARLVLMGRVVGVHGVQGWIKVESFAAPPARLIGYAPWLIQQDSASSTFEITDSRAGTLPLQVKLRDVDSRDAAQALVGSSILVAREAFPESGTDSWYWADLEGMRVVTTEGVDLGTVANLLATGANDVMVVRGDRERLIPFTQGHAVVDVSSAQRRIVVDWDPDF